MCVEANYYVLITIILFAAHKIEALVKLEAQYGQLPEYSPAIDDVLEYLKPVCHTVVKK